MSKGVKTCVRKKIKKGAHMYQYEHVRRRSKPRGNTENNRQ